MVATPLGAEAPELPILMMAGAGCVAPFMFTVALMVAVFPPSLTVTEILLEDTVPVTVEGIGLSP